MLAEGYSNSLEGSPEENLAVAADSLRKALRVPESRFSKKEYHERLVSWLEQLEDPFEERRSLHNYSAHIDRLGHKLEDELQRRGLAHAAEDERESREEPSSNAPSPTSSGASHFGQWTSNPPFGLSASETEHAFTDGSWLVPIDLNEACVQLAVQVEQFLGGRLILPRGAAQRTKLEEKRHKLVRIAVGFVYEKYLAAIRTRQLFDRIEGKESGFVLYLRGFELRVFALDVATVGRFSGSFSSLTKSQLADKLSPIPMIWASNPSESDGQNLKLESALTDGPEDWTEILRGRVQLDAEWEGSVRTLIQRASKIIIDVERDSPGLRKEIEIIGELRRVTDTYVMSGDHNPAAFSGAKSLSEDSFREIHAMATAAIDGPPLPNPACLWVSKKSRESVNEYVNSVFREWESQSDNLTEDLVADMYAFCFAATVLTEQLNKLPVILMALSRTLQRFGPNDLMKCEFLSGEYDSLAEPFIDAIRVLGTKAPSPEDAAGFIRFVEDFGDESSLVETNLEIFRSMMEEDVPAD